GAEEFPDRTGIEDVRFRSKDNLLGVCHDSVFVLRQWQRATGTRETGQVGAADFDYIRKNILPSLEELKKIETEERQRSAAAAANWLAITERERKATLEDIRRRSVAGDADAQAELGRRYGSGEGLKTDPQKAAELLKKAADAG